MVARLVRDQEVVGSNPVASTTGKRADFRRLSFPFSRTSTGFEGGGASGEPAVCARIARKHIGWAQTEQPGRQIIEDSRKGFAKQKICGKRRSRRKQRGVCQRQMPAKHALLRRGRAAKGANPVASTKTPRWHFCRLGVFTVARGLNPSRRNVWKCDALFSAVGSRERTPAVAKPSSLS